MNKQTRDEKIPYAHRGLYRRFPLKPDEMGKEYDVDIQEISRRREGITRIEGLVYLFQTPTPKIKCVSK